MPTHIKEVDFFSHHYDAGFQWYERHFSESAGGKLLGEVSPSYLHTPGVVDRVADYNPDMRIVLIVRDPIDRAVSNHKHEVRIGNLAGSDLSFEFGLENNPAYIEQGLYGKHLANWRRRFSAEQILVLKFEDVVGEPLPALARVCEFLGVDADYVPPDVDSKSNESYLNRSRRLESAKNAVRGVVRSVGLGGLWRRVGDLGLRDSYRRANRVEPGAVIAPPQPDTLQRLKTKFREDLDEFERLSGLSTANWLQQ